MKKFCRWILLGAVGVADAATFVVDTTSDAGSLITCSAAPGDCSFRGALALGDLAGGNDTVAFNIPLSDPGCVAATGVCTILPATVYPSMNSRIDLDGTTQPGWVPNTLTAAQAGNNAQLKIVISGSSCGGASGCDGLLYFSDPGTVRGLVINGFRTNSGGGTALSFFRNSGGVVEGCYIGTDVSGHIAVPNGYGISFSGNPFGGEMTSNGRVGGLLPAQRNLISGNSNDGVLLNGANHRVLGNLIGSNAAGNAALGNRVGVVLRGGAGFVQFVGDGSGDGRNLISGNLFAGISVGGAGATNGHRIIGNFIGTDATGVLPLGNGTMGVQINAVPAAGTQSALVGGAASGEGNVIAFNGTQGVAARAAFGGQVIGNRIFGNGQLGISLGTGDNGHASVRTPNDPGDADQSANRGQNFPAISARALNGGAVDLTYAVDSTVANSNYPLRVEFFKADGDEGRELIGVDSYSAAQAQAPKAISLPIPGGLALTANDQIVATATDAAGNTSEFSFTEATLAIQTVTPSLCGAEDGVFCDGYESEARASLKVVVHAAAALPPFAPNGRVLITDNRGHSCSARLSPTETALVSSGECILVGAGAAGSITITAVLDAFGSAFASASGGNPSTNTQIVVP